jgi:hypothetical protein
MKVRKQPTERSLTLLHSGTLTTNNVPSLPKLYCDSIPIPDPSLRTVEEIDPSSIARLYDVRIQHDL